jgi:hypothetical protein
MTKTQVAGLLLIAWACSLGCDTHVPPTNPYDPETPPADQAPCALRGVVLSEVEQGLIHGAMIILEGPTVPGESPMTTGQDGAYAFRELIPGTYLVSVSHPAHFDKTRVVRLEPGEDRTLDLSLAPLPGDVTEDSGHLTGVILKAGQLSLPQDEQDHSGIVVEIEAAAVRTITNRAGVFDLFVSPGTYRISLQATDYRPLTVANVVVAAMTDTVLPGSPITLDPNPGRVSGLVALEGLADPALAGTQVALLGSESASTADDGSFLISDVPPGVYTLQITRDNYDTQNIPGVVVQGGQESLMPEVTLSLARGGVRGQVQLEGSDTHEGVVVEVVGTSVTAVSNSSGEFVIEGLEVGVYALSARKLGWLPASIPTVTVDADTTVDIGTVDLDINPGTVVGRVTREGEQLHDGITITLSPGSLSTTSAADGAFYINGVVQGAYTLVATSPGFTSASASLLVSPGQTTTVPDLALAVPRGSVAGTVQVEDGGQEEFESVRVDLFNPDYSDTSFVLVDGSYAFSDTPTGTYSLVARLNGYVQDRVDGIVVTQGSTAAPRILVLRKSTGGFLICPPARPCGARFTTDTGVSLQLDDDGGVWTSMRLSEDPTFTVVNPGDQPYVAFDSNPPFTLSGADGPKAIYAQYKDDLDNDSAILSAAITLDTAPPYGASVVINGGSGYTNNTLYQLSLAAIDEFSGVVEMKISEDANFADDSWIGFDDVRSHPTSPGAPPGGDGLKEIRVIFRDAAGNEMLPADAAVDDIVLDRVPPVLNGITLDCNGVPGAGTCSTPVVSIRIDPDSQAPDSTVAMAFSNTGSFSAATFVGFDTPVSWLLTPGDGLKTVFAMLRDAAGNESPGIASDTITIDTTPPAAGTISLAGGALFTNSATVALQVTGEANAFVELTGTLVEAGVYPLAGVPANITLSGPDGVKEVEAVLIDPAGNRSLPFSTGIVLDRLPPYAVSVTIDGGAAYTTDPLGQVSLTLTATDVTSGVDQIRISSDGTFDTEPLEPFVLSRAYTLNAPGTQGQKTVRVRFHDLAGNQTEAQASITLDYSPPTFSAAVSGRDLPQVPGRTALRTVDLTLSNIAGSPTAMKASSQAGFGDASWIPVASGTWELSGGDGLKTVYVKLTDAAGNESTVAQPQIELDTTGPETPSIQVADIDGDGFALSANEVELEWSLPADGDLAGFTVQRLVAGVDVSYQFLQDLGSGTLQFTDTNALPGSPNSYRIRAFDDLGNASGWSGSAVARPFEPITAVNAVRTRDRSIYEFRPPAGAFWLQAAYSWENLDHTPGLLSLPLNTPTFESPFYQDRFNEMLTLRAWNQDSTLVFQSDVPLWNNQRLVLVDGVSSDFYGLDTDMRGAAHVSYVPLSSWRVEYATNASGVWETAWQGPSGDATDLVVDDADGVHILFADNDDLYYATNQSGAWQTVPADALPVGNMADWKVSLALDSAGFAHACWHDGTANTLRYATNASGSWAAEVVAPAGGNSYAGCDLVLDSTDEVHISYFVYSGSEIRVASGRAGMSWNIETVAAGMGSNNGIAVDRFDNLHLVFAQNRLRYATNASGAWVTAVLSPRSNHADITVLESGEIFIGHDDSSQAGDAGYTVSDGSGGWITRWVDTQEDVGDRVDIAVDRYGAVHLLYQGYGSQLRYTADRSMVAFDGPVEDDGNWEKNSSVAVDRMGRAQVAYTNETDSFRTARSVGLGWEYDDVESGTRVYYPTAAVDDDGGLHLLYMDRDADLLKIADNVSGTWVSTDLAPGVGGNHLQASLAIDSAGASHVMYCKRSGPPSVYYATDASGSWIGEEAVTLSDYPAGCPIAVDGAGTVHTVYHDHVNRTIDYVSGTAGNWSTTVIDSGMVNVSMAALGLALDATGHVHVIYWKDTQSRMFYATNASGAWTTSETGFVIGGQAPFFLGMAIDPEGYVHLAYNDQDLSVTYVTNRFGDWRRYTLSSWARDLPGSQHPTLAIDDWGQLFLSYCEDPITSDYDVRLAKDFMARELPATSVVQTSPF